MHKEIFKIFRPEEWDAFETRGLYQGSADDISDGFIHLSAEDQVDGTLAKHFAKDDRLVMARLDLAAQAIDLKWEISRAGQAFPHLYCDLPLTAVVQVFHIDKVGDAFPRLATILKTL